MYRVTERVFITSYDDMKKNKRASIGDIVNEHLADNPRLEPINIHCDFDTQTKTYTIQAWFKYKI
jgi:hypothetical protein